MPASLPAPDAWEYIEVRRSNLHGRGLFAARDLPKGTYVMEYLGERMGKREGTRRTDEQWARGRVYTFELNKRFDLDGSIRSNLARLANFSCEPNCESQNERGRRIWIVAIKDIRKSSEITYDYNFSFVEPPPVCRCGSRRCRGYIVGEEHIGDLLEWLDRSGRKAQAAKVRRQWVKAKGTARAAGKGHGKGKT
ncbi:MAG TPA: SET domain-containing protein-lysine N-methyltransferase [Candidatus Thermoplasmatota archaeon]|nr:SET domain-containing protein-lysine N-methyltransferase [Candidatus Thermoplasmatota archaeon]